MTRVGCYMQAQGYFGIALNSDGTVSEITDDGRSTRQLMARLTHSHGLHVGSYYALRYVIGVYGTPSRKKSLWCCGWIISDSSGDVE